MFPPVVGYKTVVAHGADIWPSLTSFAGLEVVTIVKRKKTEKTERSTIKAHFFIDVYKLLKE